MFLRIKTNNALFVLPVNKELLKFTNNTKANLLNGFEFSQTVNPNIED